ncbi:hypothetical protein ABDX87_23485 [Pseudomonas abietaniphila]|uniref:hypothetical protein n=1 Tax=Pseudomonas abietaniphila TaxID=89065 RepID=UPI0032168791
MSHELDSAACFAMPLPFTDKPERPSNVQTLPKLKSVRTLPENSESHSHSDGFPSSVSVLGVATSVIKSQKTLADTLQNFQEGTVGYLNVTAAQAQVLRNQQNLAKTNTRLNIDLVNL